MYGTIYGHRLQRGYASEESLGAAGIQERGFCNIDFFFRFMFIRSYINVKELTCHLCVPKRDVRIMVLCCSDLLTS